MMLSILQCLVAVSALLYGHCANEANALPQDSSLLLQTDTGIQGLHSEVKLHDSQPETIFTERMAYVVCENCTDESLSESCPSGYAFEGLAYHESFGEDSERKAVACMSASFLRASKKEKVRPHKSEEMPPPVDISKMLWVMISGYAESNNNFADRIIPAAETYLHGAPKDTVFAVFVQNDATIDMLSRSACAQSTAHSVVKDHHKFRGATTEYTCATQGADVHVILTSCPDDNGHGHDQSTGPLCKWDAAIAHLDATGRLNGAEWIQIGDDDVYTRVSPMMQLLALSDHTKKLFINNVGDSQKQNICPWQKTILGCNDQAPQCACWGMMSVALAKAAAQDQKSGGVKKAGVDAGSGGTDAIVPYYLWTLGAEFMPMHKLYDNLRDKPVTEAFVKPKIAMHGIRKADAFHSVAAIDSATPFEFSDQFLEEWVPHEAGRAYGGVSDQCSSALAPRTEGYWWMDSEKGF